MRLTPVRNATLQLEHAGRRILVDPMLADQDAYPGFEGTVNSHLRNPLVALPMPAEGLLESSAHPVETIAELVDFPSAASLRQHFRARFEVSPSEWRRRFGP